MEVGFWGVDVNEGGVEVEGGDGWLVASLGEDGGGTCEGLDECLCDIWEVMGGLCGWLDEGGHFGSGFDRGEELRGNGVRGEFPVIFGEERGRKRQDVGYVVVDLYLYLYL